MLAKFVRPTSSFAAAVLLRHLVSISGYCRRSDPVPCRKIITAEQFGLLSAQVTRSLAPQGRGRATLDISGRGRERGWGSNRHRPSERGGDLHGCGAKTVGVQRLGRIFVERKGLRDRSLVSTGYVMRAERV